LGVVIGINPQEYLADVLPRLARGLVLRDVPNFAPAAWKLARATAARLTQRLAQVNGLQTCTGVRSGE
jgi:hypothetical protein